MKLLLLNTVNNREEVCSSGSQWVFHAFLTL